MWCRCPNTSLSQCAVAGTRQHVNGAMKEAAFSFAVGACRLSRGMTRRPRTGGACRLDPALDRWPRSSMCTGSSWKA